MTSLGTTLKLIDAALFDKYSGFTIKTGSPETDTSIAVFMEEPFTEEYRERIYPSISIKFIAVHPDPERSEADEGEEEEISYDFGVVPNIRNMRRNPEPYRIIYSINTWHKVRTSEDRDLVSSILIGETPTRGYLTIKNIDDEDIDVWMLWSPGIGLIHKDEEHSDYIIYHKILTVTILAHLANVLPENIRQEKVAMEANWDIYSRKSVYTDTDIEVYSEEFDVLDGTFSYTDTTEEG